MTLTLKALGFAYVLLSMPSLLAAAQTVTPVDPMTRVSATLNGVFSPRGFFNVLVPLRKIQGVKAVKLDLAKSRLTIDFAPGNPVSPA